MVIAQNKAKGGSHYTKKIVEKINCSVILILLCQNSDELVTITGVLDGQIIITLSIFKCLPRQ